MNKVRFTITIFSLIVFAFLSPKALAQEGSIPQGGCSALDKSKPPLFISFESLDEKSWDGNKYVKGALLRLNNNSNCTINFSAAVGEAQVTPIPFTITNGKMVRQPDVRTGSLTNGQRVSLYYLTKYPDKKLWVIGGFGGDVLETVYLNGNNYVFFGVPLKNFQDDGEILLPYNYDWDAQIIIDKDGHKQRFATVEHYLRFVPEQLPANILK